MYKEIIELAQKHNLEYKENELLSKYTSFRTGGKADLIVFPNDIKSLSEILLECNNINADYYILGNGSNVIAPDDGYKGIIIKFDKCFGDIKLIDDTTIYCKAGLPLKSLCLFALENNLSGLEFAYGIPGTLGGAIYMNAGAYGGEMKDILVSVSHIDKDGNEGVFTADKLDLGYRHSIYSDNSYVITSAILKFEKSDNSKIKALMNENMQKRKDKQPLEFPSAGSTFKRPEGYFAGALIEKSGLKGITIGGAQVSEKHAGFIINKGNAKSKDILDLISFVQDKVYKDSGVMLETEVKILA